MRFDAAQGKRGYPRRRVDRPSKRRGDGQRRGLPRPNPRGRAQTQAQISTGTGQGRPRLERGLTRGPEHCSQLNARPFPSPPVCGSGYRLSCIDQITAHARYSFGSPNRSPSINHDRGRTLPSHCQDVKNLQSRPMLQGRRVDAGATRCRASRRAATRTRTARGRSEKYEGRAKTMPQLFWRCPIARSCMVWSTKGISTWGT